MIQKLTLSDIDQVVAIHLQELEGFLPQLGAGFLKKFYKESLSIPELFTFVFGNGDKVIGFVSGVESTNGLYKKILSKDLGGFTFVLLKHFITKPNHLLKVFSTMAYPGFSQDHPELLTIAVEKKSQKKGIGKSLFSQTAKEFSKRNIKGFRISVYDRLPANGFYRKIGCLCEGSFLFLGEKMNYYSFKI